VGAARAPGRLGSDAGFPAAGPGVGRSERVYASLLRAYPARFRSRYGSEMVVLFGDQLREARAAGRAGGVAVTWFRSIVDLTANAFGEHLRRDRTMAQSLATFEPTRSMRWLGLVGLVGGALLLLAAVPVVVLFETRLANSTRLVLFGLGQAAIALAFYRRQALVAPRLAVVTTALTVGSGVFYAAWTIVAWWVPNPFSGTFGAFNLTANGILWISGGVYGVALLRTGAAWAGMTPIVRLVARIGAVALLGSFVAWIVGDDPFGLVRSVQDHDQMQLLGSVGIFGVLCNGAGWAILGSVLVLGGRGVRGQG